MIWCVEDDGSIREIEVYTLNSTGLRGPGLCRRRILPGGAARRETPELVLLDVMLPGEDGVALLRCICGSCPGRAAIPVIMATAKGTEYDKVQSLDLGADDYLVKPFGMMEMVSRVKAVLRRCAPGKPEPPAVQRRRDAGSGRPHRHGGRAAGDADLQGIRAAAAVSGPPRHGLYPRPAV